MAFSLRRINPWYDRQLEYAMQSAAGAVVYPDRSEIPRYVWFPKDKCVPPEWRRGTSDYTIALAHCYKYWFVIDPNVPGTRQVLHAHFYRYGSIRSAGILPSDTAFPPIMWLEVLWPGIWRWIDPRLHDS